MNSIDERVIAGLTELAEACRDGQRSFTMAAESAELESGERELVQAYAAERGEYVRELQAQIFALGGKGEEAGGVAGSLHRGWMNLRSAITSREAAALLSACAEAEAAALRAYHEVLKTELDPETRAILTRQARGVEGVLQGLRQTRDVVANA